MTHRHILVLAVFCTTIIVLSSCAKMRRQDVAPMVDSIGVRVVAVDSVPNGVTRTYVGEVEENASLSVGFVTGGVVRQVFVHEGNRVQKGQLLAIIDSQNAQNAYNAAHASFTQAEDGYRRLKSVYEKGSVAEVKWVEMQTNLEKARSMEEIAKKQLGDCSLFAPCSGVVASCEAKVGINMFPGQSAFTLLDMQSVQISFSVPENEIASVELGREGKITVAALADLSFVGKVTDRSLTANHVSHSFRVKMALPNPKGDLLPGMVCKVHLKQSRKTGLTIPAKVVQTRPEGMSVWVVENGKAVRRAVRSDEFMANGVLVTEGLAQGDTVITSGFQKLYDNAVIKIINDEN